MNLDRVRMRLYMREYRKRTNYSHDYEYQQKNREKINKKQREVYNPQRIKFKGKQIQIGINPRKGICSKCGKKAETDMHHTKYDRNNVLANTVELCNSCHIKETWRTREWKYAMTPMAIKMRERRARLKIGDNVK